MTRLLLSWMLHYSFKFETNLDSFEVKNRYLGLGVLTNRVMHMFLCQVFNLIRGLGFYRVSCIIRVFDFLVCPVLLGLLNRFLAISQFTFCPSLIDILGFRLLSVLFNSVFAFTLLALHHWFVG